LSDKAADVLKQDGLGPKLTHRPQNIREKIAAISLGKMLSPKTERLAWASG
jgi:hypothetical protein